MDIDWKYWAAGVTATVKQAALLSVGCSPEDPNKDGVLIGIAGDRIAMLERYLKSGNVLWFLQGQKSGRPIIESVVSLPEFGAWLLSYGHDLPDGFPRQVKQESHISEKAVPPAVTSGAPESDAPHSPPMPADWIERARAVACAYIARHREQNLFPSQSDVCEHVAKELREAKVYGPHGKPLRAEYIQRNAIQGDWWKANKP